MERATQGLNPMLHTQNHTSAQHAETEPSIRQVELRPSTPRFLQRYVGNNGMQEVPVSPSNAVPPIVHEVLRSPGQPLDDDTRAFMEPRFGQDFSRVRVHTDTKASESAQAVNALAYTVGRDVIFGAGQYQPQSTEGKRLMAHELTHIAQQSRSVQAIDAESIQNFSSGEQERSGDWTLPASSANPALKPSLALDPPHSPAEAVADYTSYIVVPPTFVRSKNTTQSVVPVTASQLMVQRQPVASALFTELQHDIECIKSELDSLIYTEAVEDRVIGILMHWAERGSLASGYLDWIFDSLQIPKSGFFSDTTYYDAILDRFERVNEVRQLREGTLRYRGRESAKETERQSKELETLSKRREADKEAAAAGGWSEDIAVLYDLPPTPQNLYLAELEIGRLERTSSDQLLPNEKAAVALLSTLEPKERPKALLRKTHFVTESERSEQRKAQLREIILPLLDVLAWATAERIAKFLADIVVARLFAAEAGTVMGLAVGESEAAVGALTRRGAVEGGFASAEGSMIVREGYAYRIESVNPVTGEVVAKGYDLTTREIVTVQVNIDTKAGIVTRASGETLPIHGGHIELSSAQRSLGEATTKAGTIVREVRATPIEQGRSYLKSEQTLANENLLKNVQNGTRGVSDVATGDEIHPPPPAAPAVRPKAVENIDKVGQIAVGQNQGATGEIFHNAPKATSGSPPAPVKTTRLVTNNAASLSFPSGSKASSSIVVPVGQPVNSIGSISPKGATWKVISLKSYEVPPELEALPFNTIIEFPNGARAWRLSDGTIANEWRLAPTVERLGEEDLMFTQSKKGYQNMARLHSAPPILGHESPFGIKYGHHRLVNLRYQEHGIEKYIALLRNTCPPGVKYNVLTYTRGHLGGERLRQIVYQVDAIVNGQRKTAIVFQIDISNTKGVPTVLTSGLRSTDPAIVPLLNVVANQMPPLVQGAQWQALTETVFSSTVIP